MSEETNSGSIHKVSGVPQRRHWIPFLPALLVFYSIVKEFKIATPFMYKYQIEFLNYTAATLNGEV